MKNEVSIYYEKDIAIMGGSFDPIHYGHLVSAESVLKKFGVEKIIFIPIGESNYKKVNNAASKDDRYNMTVLATITNINFDVSRLEIDRRGITYTIDTILEIKKYCKKNIKIYFIIGADLVEGLLKWKDIKSIFNLCEFVVVSRWDYNKKNVMKKINELKNEFNTNIHFVEIPNIDISSREIKKMILRNKSIKYLLPESVESYIYKNNLYKKLNFIEVDLNIADKFLKDNLSEHRYNHSIGVAEEAVKLAKEYEEDENKAYLAALLHDIAREYSEEEMIYFCKKYKIELDCVMKEQINICHGYVGAEIVREKFGITDIDILNSIRYHTTGRKNMTKLEKIIYIADIIEPNRGENEDLNLLRNITYNDLDEAIIKSLIFNMRKCIEKKIMFHPLSLDAMNYLNN